MLPMTQLHTPLSLMDRLKAGTDAHHRHAETRRLQKMMAGGTISPVLYRAYMAQLLLVHRALDGWLVEAESQRPALSALKHEHHRHVTHLEADTAVMGVCDEEAAPLPATRRFIEHMHATIAAEPLLALGVLYVLEGSMNGNRFIARALRTAFGSGSGGLSYLDPYGDAQRDTWLGFRARANALEVPQAVADAMLETAQSTFDAIAAISDEVMG